MGRADEIRRADEPATGQYACEECGVPLGERYETCPECSSAAIVALDDVIDPEFRG